MEGLKRLIFLPGKVLWPVALSATVLLVLCLNGTIDSPAVHYFAYLYSTYALVTVCAWLPRAFRWSRQGVMSLVVRLAERFPRLNRLLPILTNVELRTEAFLVPCLIGNLLFAAFKLAVGLWVKSPWFIGVGIYYAVLASLRYILIRGFVSKNLDKDPEGAWRAYRATAIQLMVLTVVISGLIVQTILFGRSYSYPGVLIYALALYAFIKIIVAVIALARQSRGENRVLAASRCISFAGALMSMMSLQTALLDRFGDPEYARGANTLFGAFVCLSMLTICARMLTLHHRHVREA